MILVCICGDSLLTVGKQYEAFDENSFSYLINCDCKDIRVWMAKSMFISIENYREIKLNELLYR